MSLPEDDDLMFPFDTQLKPDAEFTRQEAEEYIQALLSAKVRLRNEKLTVPVPPNQLPYQIHMDGGDDEKMSFFDIDLKEILPQGQEQPVQMDCMVTLENPPGVEVCSLTEVMEALFFDLEGKGRIQRKTLEVLVTEIYDYQMQGRVKLDFLWKNEPRLLRAEIHIQNLTRQLPDTPKGAEMAE